MKNIFCKHPHSVGESYWKHFVFAFCLGTKILVAGCVCIVHALFPFLFEKTGSNILFKVLLDFVNRSPHVEERLQSLARAINLKGNQHGSHWEKEQNSP